MSTRWPAKLQPTAEDLADLSRLYNKRRLLQHKITDLKEELYQPINELRKVADTKIYETFGKELEQTLDDIKFLKLKFRMKIRSELWWDGYTPIRELKGE